CFKKSGFVTVRQTQPCAQYSSQSSIRNGVDPPPPIKGSVTTRASLVSTLDLPAVNLSSPGAGFHAPVLDKVFETFQIAFDSSRNKSERIANLLADALRFIGHPQGDAGPPLTQRLKHHHTGIRSAGRASPCDAIVRNLLVDFRIPLFAFPADVYHPMQALVIQLLHPLDAFHKAWELLELCPLVINARHRDIDFN